MFKLHFPSGAVLIFGPISPDEKYDGTLYVWEDDLEEEPIDGNQLLGSEHNNDKDMERK